jgi:aspartyl-tRNA(Asn)/glutamyl-tRNA(Gln) amidotransferase subunit B
MGEVLRILKERNWTIASFPVSTKQLAELLALVAGGTISGSAAKTVFQKMVDSGKSAPQIVEEDGLAQISDSSAVIAIVDDVIAANPEQVASFRGGKEQILGFLVGQVMKASRGKANPQMAKELLQERLGSGNPA